MGKIAKMLAPFGIMGIIFVMAYSSVGGGLVGAAIFTTAMATLGPGGMIGGVVTLIVSGALTAVIAEFGVKAVVWALVKVQLQHKTKEEISTVKFFPKALKQKTIKLIEETSPDSPDPEDESV